MNNHLKIAIQGGQASFHHLATQQHFSKNSIAIAECQTFRQVCDVLQKGKADLAVMAIENILVGSILPNYSLLEEYSFNIIGETFLYIQQHLMALPGQKLEEIKIVRSHPMALLQCSDFLEANPNLKILEAFDTADSAKEIREDNRKHIGAIASREAARKYNLQILAEDIENIKQNYTRFLILSTENNGKNQDADKASISFHLNHHVGALADVLAIFKRNGINLTLIQSVPIPGKIQEYAFHCDLEWENPDAFKETLDEVKSLSEELHVLGIYKGGEKPFNKVKDKSEINHQPYFKPLG
jgi:prephenate dehydratase